MLLRLLCILSISAAAYSMPIAEAGGDYSLLSVTPVDQAPTSAITEMGPMKPETVSPELQDASESPANDFPVVDLGAPVPAPITSAPTDDGTAKVEKMMDSMITQPTLDPSVQSANLPLVAPPCNITDPTGTIPLSPPVSPVPMMSSTQLEEQGTVGVDGKCTTSNDCAPGNCCSEFGFCGNTIEFCNTRSKPPVSIPCPSPLPAVNDPVSSLPPPPSAPAEEFAQDPVNPAPANCPCANPPVTVVTDTLTVPSTPPISLPTTVPSTDPFSFSSTPVSTLDSPTSPPPTGEVVGTPPSTLPTDVPVNSPTTYSPTTLPTLTPTSNPADCETNTPDQLNASSPPLSTNDPNLLQEIL